MLDVSRKLWSVVNGMEVVGSEENVAEVWRGQATLPDLELNLLEGLDVH